LHGDAGGIADFDPDTTQPEPVAAALGNDTLGAKLARVGEDRRTILGDVFVEEDAASESRS
jgi:hypothetical protein